MIKIIVDCLGGDHSPAANIDGAINALKKYDDLYVVFTGDAHTINAQLKQRMFTSDRVEVVHAPEEITGEDKPTDAIRLKRESSMIKGIKMLREDETINAMVSTGATGALVAAATLRIGRIENVRRPAFCPILPTMSGGIVGVCDSGANVTVNPDMLLQFAIMGSEYLKGAFGVENPRVAMLNVGVETEKGDDLRKAAYPMLSECKYINFVGNMESRDLLSGKYDLIVCDGFSGNVLIKSTEGACLEMLKMLKRDIYSSFKYKIGAAFMKKMFMKEKEFMNYHNYGGSVLLGSEKIVVKGHGSSNATSVEKCIEQAYRMQQSGLNGNIRDTLSKIYG
ncbi:MAG: phosphate acyltransferase PlsX [Clostridia bacterium]|nr:phosphate acyltransferase PlsX [Clostridia bacterium]